MAKKKYECKKCHHQVDTTAGMRGHIWAKHRNKGKDKTPIRKGVDFGMVETLRDEDFKDSSPRGLECLSDAALAEIIEYDIRIHGQLTNGTSTIALEELCNRDYRSHR